MNENTHSEHYWWFVDLKYVYFRNSGTRSASDACHTYADYHFFFFPEVYDLLQVCVIARLVVLLPTVLFLSRVIEAYLATMDWITAMA